MKKRILALVLCMLMAFALVAACGDTDDGGSAPDGGSDNGSAPAASGDVYTYPTGPRGEGVTINVWAWNEELYNAFVSYKEANPDFLYELKLTTYDDNSGEYEQALNAALIDGGSSVPDIFVTEQAFVINYTKFDFAEYAVPFEELFGVDPAKMIADAQISKVIQEAGTNPDGKIVSLGFQSTGSGFIYRRSLADQIWGASDPDTVAGKIGPGWDKFTQAAAEAKEAGVYMVAGEGDLWQAIRQSPNQWVQNGKLVIDDQRMKFLDIGKTFYENDYSLKSPAWQPAWFGAMNGEDPVLGFLGPAWLINYTLAENCGDTYGDWAVCMPPEPFNWGGSFSIVNKDGNPDARAGLAELVYWTTLDTSDTGFQYAFANGLISAAKDAVASGVVMDKSDGSLEMMGGQNIFEVFIPAGASGTASGWGPHDRTINQAFQDHAIQYFSGAYADQDEMISAFQQEIYDKLRIES